MTIPHRGKEPEFYKEPTPEEWEQERIRYDELLTQILRCSATVRGWLSDDLDTWRPPHVADPSKIEELRQERLLIADPSIDYKGFTAIKPRKRQIIPARLEICPQCNGKRTGLFRAHCTECNGTGKVWADD